VQLCEGAGEGQTRFVDGSEVTSCGGGGAGDGCSGRVDVLHRSAAGWTGGVAREPKGYAVLVEQVGARELQGSFILKELVLANEARGLIFEVGDGAVEV
jgi:hypothetical protein